MNFIQTIHNTRMGYK